MENLQYLLRSFAWFHAPGHQYSHAFIHNRVILSGSLLDSMPELHVSCLGGCLIPLQITACPMLCRPFGYHSFYEISSGEHGFAFNSTIKDFYEEVTWQPCNLDCFMFDEMREEQCAAEHWTMLNSSNSNRYIWVEVSWWNKARRRHHVDAAR